MPTTTTIATIESGILGSMIEAGVVIDKSSSPVFWHAPSESTAGSIPDSRALWDFLWEHRDSIFGFAHSHPGGDVPGPSGTDLTTFSAVERALGQRLTWWIVNADAIAWVRWHGPDLLDYESGLSKLFSDSDPWVVELRRRSGIVASLRAGGAR